MGFWSKAVRFLPLVVAVVGLLTLVVVQIMAHTCDRTECDFGGLDLPYVSDTGKDKPQYYIFAIGLAITGGAFGLVGLLNLFNILRMHPDSAHVVRMSYTSAALAILAGIFLVLLALFDTKHAPTVHLIAAILFFLCSAIYMTLVVASYWILRKEEGDNFSSTQILSLRIKVVILIIYWLAFLLYIPVGLPLFLAPAYVYDEQTGTYDYSDFLAVNYMRTVSQYVCIVTTLVFNVTLYLDFKDAESDPDWYP